MYAAADECGWACVLFSSTVQHCHALPLLCGTIVRSLIVFGNTLYQVPGAHHARNEGSKRFPTPKSYFWRSLQSSCTHCRRSPQARRRTLLAGRPPGPPCTLRTLREVSAPSSRGQVQQVRPPRRMHGQRSPIKVPSLEEHAACVTMSVSTKNNTNLDRPGII